jgi:pilus assembly protein CpaF
MDVNKTVSFFEESFLKDLLSNDKVTDISYNGQDIYYVHNDYGRVKSDITLDKATAKDFIRQIANLSEKQFSYSNPELDVSFGRYRFNALH